MARGPQGPLTVEQRMALLGEAPLATSGTADAKGPHVPSSSGDGASGAAQQRKMLGTVAATDKVKLASALSSAFVKGFLQDMGEAYQQQQESLAGLRHPKTQPRQGWQQQQPGVTIMDESEGQAAAAAAAARPGVAAASEAAAAEAAAAAAAKAADLPVRTFEDWRPEPLLCKRFNVPDPYKGKAAPVEKPKFKTDFLALPDTEAAQAAVAAAEEERRRLEWQQQQQQQPLGGGALAGGTAAGAASGGLDAESFLDDLMQTVEHKEALNEAAEAAKAAAAAMGASAGAAAEPLAAGAGTAGAAAAGTSTEGTAAAETAAGAAEGDGVEGVGGEGAIEDLLPVVEKPMDLFKAIFEDVTESESEGEEEDAEQGAAATAAGAAQQAAEQLAQASIGAPAAGSPERGQELAGGRKFAGSDAPGAKGEFIADLSKFNFSDGSGMHDVKLQTAVPLSE